MISSFLLVEKKLQIVEPILLLFLQDLGLVQCGEYLFNEIYII